MRQLVQILPTDIVDIDNEPKFAEQRRSQRDEVALPTRMFTTDQRGSDVLLVNISRHGFMVREYGETPKGSIVRLALPRLGQVSGRVVWSLGVALGRLSVSGRHTRKVAPLPTPSLATVMVP